MRLDTSARNQQYKPWRRLFEIHKKASTRIIGRESENNNCNAESEIWKINVNIYQYLTLTTRHH
jgi:hypothetical protein